MRKKLIRFGGTLLVVLLLALGFVHSPILGDLVLDEIKGPAADAGYSFEADSLRFNLFTLSATLTGLRLAGPGLDVQVDEVYVNAKMTVSARNIALDTLRIDTGRIQITDALFAGETTEEEPPADEAAQLPMIDIDRLEIIAVDTGFRDQKVPINAAFNAFRFDYQNQVFEADGRFPSATAAQITTPALRFNLRGKSANFLIYEDLALTLADEENRFSLLVKGDVRADFEPDLSFEAALQPALLKNMLPADQVPRELDGVAAVTLNGDLNAQKLSATLTSAFDTGALQQAQLKTVTLPLTLSAETAWRQEETPAKATLDLGDWGRFSADLRLPDQRVKGTLSLDLRGLDGLVTDVDHVRELELDGDFDLPTADPRQGTATMDLTAQGDNAALALQASLAKGTVAFAGGGRLSEQSRLDLSGSYRDKLRLDADLALTGLQDLAPYVTLPDDLCSETIALQVSRLTLDPGQDSLTWQVGELSAAIQALAIGDVWRDDLVLAAGGNGQLLSGSLTTASGAQQQPLVVFQLNPEQQLWKQLTIAVEQMPLPVEGYQVDGSLFVDGAGPLQNPTLHGSTRLAVADAEGNPLATLATLLHLDQHIVTLQETALRSAALQANGETQLFLEALFSEAPDAAVTWQTDMNLVAATDPSFKTLIDQPLPQFALHLQGDQDLLKADLNLPSQELTVAETVLPLATPDPAHFDIDPNQPSVDGQLKTLSIAGIHISNSTVTFGDQGLKVAGTVALGDLDTLKATLGEAWPEDLVVETMTGSFQAQADPTFKDINAAFTLDGNTWQFQKQPLSFEPITVRYDGRVRLEPTTINYLGIDVAVPAQNEPLEAELYLPLTVNIRDTQALVDHLGVDWPEFLTLRTLDTEVALVGGLDGNMPRVEFEINHLDADLSEKSLLIHNLVGRYEDGIFLNPGSIEVAGIPCQVHTKDSGFSLSIPLTPDDLDVLVGGFAGGGESLLTVDWINQPQQPKLHLSLQQQSGVMVYTEPWLEIEDLALEMESGPNWSFTITRGAANLNGGTLSLDGEVQPLAEDGPQARIGVGLYDVSVTEADYQLKMTNYLQWQYAPGVNQLNGSIRLDKALLVPDLGLKTLIEDQLNAGEELYFPDPFLEEIQMTVVVQATQPITIDTDLGFLELEVPAVVVGGNLAEPIVLEGGVFINEGSVVALGNESIAFRNSQILFEATRPNDPYLQLYMDYETLTGHTPINLISYASEMSQNLDSNNLAGLVSNFLVGQVSSLISLESQFNETLFNSSFTLVVSRPLARRVVTRYALPLQEGTSKQRFELQLGPKYDSYLNFINQEDTLTTSLRHQRTFGYYDGKRPDIIRDRDFTPGDLPRWVRRKFRLNEEDEYTPTRWRHAQIDLRRRARERGYLSPDIEGNYEDHRLEVMVALGDKIDIDLVESGFAETDFALNNDKRGRIMRRLGRDTETDKRMIAQLIERMAAAEGYPSAFADVAQTDHGFTVELFTSQKIDEIGLSFGEATPILEDLLKDKAWVNQFMLDWLSSESSAHDRLRAILAARGYLTVDIGRGDFVDLTHYRIPVDPGIRGRLTEVYKNGEPVRHNLVGRPFEYGFLAKIAQDLFPNRSARVKPIPQDGDIAVNVIYTPPTETQYDDLAITNEGRVSDKNLKRFVGYHDTISKKKLIDAQNRLNETGAFRMVRLETQGEQAKLFLRERNRYSAGLEVNYDERNKAGYAIQFSDKMFLKRLDRLSMRAEHSNRIDDFFTQIRFRRLWWLPVDFQLTGRWRDNKEPIQVRIEDDDFFGQRDRTQQFEVVTEGSLEAIYKLTDTQELNAGIRMRRSTLTDITERFGPDEDFKPNNDPANLLISSENEFAVDALPINLTWVYRTLDNPSKPRSGMLLSLGVEHSIEGFGTDEAVEGTRWLGKMTRFQSWNKWMWTHRLESGIYRRTQELVTSGGGTGSGSEIETVFFLGGSTTLRGFDVEFAGPIAKETSAVLGDDFQTIVEAPTFRGVGGDAMFFMSEEMTYHTNWYWIELAGFVDTGWVWDNYDEMFDFGPAVTGGFGLGIDSPIGYFRFDWARPIVDDPLQRVIEDSTTITIEDREFARERALQEFTFRFGRTF